MSGSRERDPLSEAEHLPSEHDLGGPEDTIAGSAPGSGADEPPEGRHGPGSGDPPAPDAPHDARFSREA
jgi:hypothetical protein